MNLNLELIIFPVRISLKNCSLMNKKQGKFRIFGFSINSKIGKPNDSSLEFKTTISFI